MCVFVRGVCADVGLVCAVHVFMGVCMGPARGSGAPSHPTAPKTPCPSAHRFPAVPFSPGASAVGLAAAPDVRSLQEEAVGEEV